MYLLQTARELLARGYSLEAVRTELRRSETSNGDNPTASYVEEVIRAALKRRAKDHARRRRYRDNRKLKRAQAMTVELVVAGDSTMYRVIGERIHEVWIDERGVTCDCGNTCAPCAHVIAVTDHTIRATNRLAVASKFVKCQ